jgi:protein-S-isoprenylcysteine O-methyltransferase Ste14
MSNLWLILYCSWCLSEVLLVVLTRTRRSSGGTLSDRGSIFVLWIVIFASIWMGSWYGATHPHTMFGGTQWLRHISLGMMIAGLAIRWTSIASLGRAFSVNVAIRTDQQLYRRGLFALVRHPSYTGMMIIFAAIGVRTRNWIALAILVVPTFAALLYRMHVEEAALEKAFGVEYEEYRQTTKRLLPGLY